MSGVAAARSIFRSAAVRNGATRFASSAKASRSPLRMSTRTPLTNRLFSCPCELSSMQPFHTATASSLMTSMLTLSRRGYGWLPEEVQMDLRTTKEQKLYMDVLQTIAIPRGGNDINWLSIDLWNAVTDEYNRRAPQCGVVERTMPSLIQLGKKLRYCNCMTGQKCSCPVPEFPIIDGPGEPSSHVSLGTGSASHNSHLAANEASHTLQTVTSELMRLRKAGKFSWDSLGNYTDAWERELNRAAGYGKLFLSGNDQEKVKLTKMVFKKHQIA